MEANLSNTPKKVEKFTLGWMIVGFTATAQFFSVGIGYYTFGVYLIPLTEALDVSRFSVSIALSIQTILIAIFSPLLGRFLAEYPVKVLMSLGVTCLSLGLVICAHATAIWHIYIGFGLVIGVGVTLTGNLPCNLILANWFVRRRGMALGISQAGITISGVLLVPLASYFVTRYGWNNSFMVFAVFVPIILLPLIWKFAIRHPQDMGLNPDGDLSPLPVLPISSKDWSFRYAIRERDLWLISLIAGPCYMAIAAIVIALPSHSADLGLTTMQGATAVLVTTLFGSIAKPLAGTFSDYFPKRLVVAIAIGLQVFGTFLILIANDLATLCLAGVFFGLGYGGIAPLWSLLLVERFGLENFSKVMGAAMPLTMPFSLIGLPLTTLVFDMTGSYRPAFACLFIAFFISAVCLWLLRLPTERGGKGELSA